MLLTSTYTTNAASDIPVLIVCYGTRRVFMLKAHTYSEMIAHIRHKFDIDVVYTVNLETMALDVCRGSKVEIDEDVWPVLRSSLDEVTVIVSDDSISGGVNSNAPEHQVLLVEKEEQKHGLKKVKEESLDDWMERQDKMDEVDDRPPSACSEPSQPRFGMNEDGLHRHGSEDDDEFYESDHHEEIEEEPVKPVSKSTRRLGVRFATEEPHPMHNARLEEPAQVAAYQPPQDSKFQVRVDGPNEDEGAEIKTRGSHSVKKVLGAVCQTLDLDYDRAALYVITYTEDDEGQIQAQGMLCPPDWSMARCGITSKTELRIQMELPSGSHVTQRSK